MKRAVLMIVLLMPGLFVLRVSAQQKVDTAQLMQQMRKAQELIKQKMGANAPQIQQALLQAQQRMQKDNKAAPANAKIPDSLLNITKMQMPDPSKTIGNVSADLSKNMANLQNMQAQVHQSITTGLPKKGTSSFSAVTPGSKGQIVGFAQVMLAQATQQLNLLSPALKKALDDAVKDTTITPQAQGMLLLSQKAPACAVQYMVCKGVIAQPDNWWAANTLGVVFRQEQQDKQAAQCFTYAYSLFACPLIKCNLAWAVAYYGDFITAKKYFNEIVTAIPDYDDAWQGLGMIAYQEGDTATLFTCLAHQLKVTGLGNGDGASDDFISFCGGVKMDEQMANIGQGSKADPMSDNNDFDSGSGEESQNQDPPANGNSEYPTFPSLGGIFAQNLDALPDVVKQSADFLSTIKTKKQESQANEDAATSGVSKLDEKPYIDAEGLTVTPTRYSKFVTLFHWDGGRYSVLVSAIMANFHKDVEKLVLSMSAQQVAFIDYYNNTMKRMNIGHHTEAYRDTLWCEMRPRARTEVGSNFASASAIFTKYFVQLKDAINWYIEVSTPHIKRMLKPDWNQYMNAVRENDIRQDVLKLYELWVPLQAIALGKGPAAIAFNPCNIKTEVRTPDGSGGTGDDSGDGGGPKPFTEEIKKYETPPGACDQQDKIFNVHKDYTYLKLDQDCHGTRVGIYPFVAGVSGKGGFDAGGLKGSASGSAMARMGFVLQEVEAQGTRPRYYNVGTTTNLVAEGKVSASIGDKSDTFDSKAGASAGAEGKFEANFDSGWRFNSDGGLTGKYKSANFDASITANAQASFSNSMGGHSASASYSAEAHGAIDAVAAVQSDGSYGGYNITSASFGAKSSSSSGVK